MEERAIKTDTLLALRKQYVALKREMRLEAEDFKDIKAVTDATIFGVELCIKMLDTNVAVITGNHDIIRRFLDGDDDAVGDNGE